MQNFFISWLDLRLERLLLLLCIARILPRKPAPHNIPCHHDHNTTTTKPNKYFFLNFFLQREKGGYHLQRQAREKKEAKEIDGKRREPYHFIAFLDGDYWTRRKELNKIPKIYQTTHIVIHFHKQSYYIHFYRYILCKSLLF